MASEISAAQLHAFISLSITDPRNCFKAFEFKYVQNQAVKLGERDKLIQIQPEILQFIPYLCVPPN